MEKEPEPGYCGPQSIQVCGIKTPEYLKTMLCDEIDTPEECKVLLQHMTTPEGVNFQAVDGRLFQAVGSRPKPK